MVVGLALALAAHAASPGLARGADVRADRHVASVDSGQSFARLRDFMRCVTRGEVPYDWRRTCVREFGAKLPFQSVRSGGTFSVESGGGA